MTPVKVVCQFVAPTPETLWAEAGGASPTRATNGDGGGYEEAAVHGQGVSGAGAGSRTGRPAWG